MKKVIIISSDSFLIPFTDNWVLITPISPELVEVTMRGISTVYIGHSAIVHPQIGHVGINKVLLNSLEVSGILKDQYKDVPFETHSI